MGGLKTHQVRLRFSESRLLDLVMAGMPRECAEHAQLIDSVAEVRSYKYKLDGRWQRITARESNDWRPETTIVESETRMPCWVAYEHDGLLAQLAEEPQAVFEARWRRGEMP